MSTVCRASSSSSTRLAIISLHAGALAARRDLSADQVTQTATLLQDMAHQGSEELRSLLSVLREPSGRPTTVRITDAGRIVDEARCAALDVVFTPTPGLMERLESLPTQQLAALAQSLQEGLTNAESDLRIWLGWITDHGVEPL